MAGEPAHNVLPIYTPSSSVREDASPHRPISDVTNFETLCQRDRQKPMGLWGTPFPTGPSEILPILKHFANTTDKNHPLLNLCLTVVNWSMSEVFGMGEGYEDPANISSPGGL